MSCESPEQTVDKAESVMHREKVKGNKENENNYIR